MRIRRVHAIANLSEGYRWGSGEGNSWGPWWAPPSAVAISVRTGFWRVARYLALRFDREPRKISRLRIDDDDDDDDDGIGGIAVTTCHLREKDFVFYLREWRLFHTQGKYIPFLCHAKSAGSPIGRRSVEDDEPEWREGSSVVVVILPASKVEGLARIHSRWVIVTKIRARQRSSLFFFFSSFPLLLPFLSSLQAPTRPHSCSAIFWTSSQRLVHLRYRLNSVRNGNKFVSSTFEAEFWGFNFSQDESFYYVEKYQR